MRLQRVLCEACAVPMQPQMTAVHVFRQHAPSSVRRGRKQSVSPWWGLKPIHRLPGLRNRVRPCFDTPRLSASFKQAIASPADVHANFKKRAVYEQRRGRVTRERVSSGVAPISLPPQLQLRSRSVRWPPWTRGQWYIAGSTLRWRRCRLPPVRWPQLPVPLGRDPAGSPWRRPLRNKTR